MEFVVATDGSTESERALAHALDLAAATDGSVTVIHAVDPAVYDTGGEGPVADVPDAENRLLVESEADAEARGEELLAAAERTVSEAGGEAEGVLLHGDPVAVVPEYAESEGFDGIVVGHRGRSARGEQVLGSVAKGFVERADVPVTVVG
jgi:nucleotide-binding universal stress UspA family protein